jgi:hypothetical protein
MGNTAEGTGALPIVTEHNYGSRPNRTIYLVGAGGSPNFGDELTIRRWLRHLNDTEPGATVWVDTPNPGSTATVMAEEHPGLRTTDTIYRLASEAANDEAQTVAAFVHRALDYPATASRWIPGIEVLRSLGPGDVFHVTGGGYINARRPRNVGVIAAAAWVSANTPAMVAATGLGLMPGDAGVKNVWADVASEFDVLTVRDAPSLALVSSNSAALIEPGVALMGGLTGAVMPDASSAPKFMVCVQSDMLDQPFAVVVDSVRALLHTWGATGTDVGFVECKPEVDRHIFDALVVDFPGARYYTLWDLLRDGMPARSGQRWISSRYHPHLLAAGAGAAGVVMVVNDDYCAVNYEAVRALGSAWTLVKPGGEAIAAGGPGSLPAQTALYAKNLAATARNVYGASSDSLGWAVAASMFAR